MDDRTFYAAVAERAGLSKEEAADLSRATLEAIGAQISGGEVRKLTAVLPGWASACLPRHDNSAHPVAVPRFIEQIARRTGLTEEETRRGVSAVLSALRAVVDSRSLDHALSLLPKDYRELAAAGA